jgi:dynein heavy chain 2, cytosolic
MAYLTAIIEHFLALDKWVSSVDSISKFFDQVLDLSELFKPDVFLNSLRQQAARDAKISMDEFKLVCSFDGPMRGVNLNVKIAGLQLEGCSFDGSRLCDCLENSPSVISLPPCFIGWIQKVFVILNFITKLSL